MTIWPRRIVRAWTSCATWQATRNIKLQVQALRQEADAAVKAAGGRDGDFVMAIVQYRF
jgi:phosphate-selective porin